VWHYFEFGAYADDHHERNELAIRRQRPRKSTASNSRRAHLRARRYSARYHLLPDDGAQAVAIATGNSPWPNSARFGPDFLSRISARAGGAKISASCPRGKKRRNTPL